MTGDDVSEALPTGGHRPRSIRVLLVDDHEMVATGLGAVLGDEADLDVVGVAGSLERAVAFVASAHPHVVVMDYRLLDGDGGEGTRRVHAVDPAVNVVMLTAATDEQVLAEALAAGCCGFVTKGATVETLVAAIRAGARGDGSFSPEMVARLARLRASDRPGWPGRAELTAREVQVLQSLVDGQTTSAIARQLALSEHTVRNHVRNVLAKLGAHTKLEAVVIAARTGVIDVHGR